MTDEVSWREGVTSLAVVLVVCAAVHLVDETTGATVVVVVINGGDDDGDDNDDGFPNISNSPTLFRVSLSGLR